ncbi:MAG TPA: Ig-like domain-containing protein, partial [Thermoleophilaceae bacterium]|nr:Ig-like domain-containing protein [Thermoleophilaceae bacterium]
VDTTAPAVTLTSPADGAFTNDTTPSLAGAAGSATGDSGTVTVKIWSGPSASGAVVRTISVGSVDSSWSAEITPALADGQYSARAEQQDTAGNTGTSATRTFTIDSDPPEATITAGPSGTVGSSDAVFEFSSNEPDGAAFECSLNGASVSACTSGASFSSLADGAHRFEVRAIDRAGNRGSWAVREWTVSASAPLVPTSPGELPIEPVPAPAGAAPQVMPLEESLRDVLRRGVVAQFACRGACRADGALLLSARAARRLGLAGAARSVVVGRASRRLDAAGAGALTVKLTRRARTALARTSSTSLVLRLTVSEETGERSTRRRALTLRRLDMADRLRRGVRLSVACAESCRAAATLRVARATARRLRLARTVIARGSLTLASAGSGRLTVTFTRAARRRLRSASLVPARLTVVVSASGGDVTLARRLDLRG